MNARNDRQLGADDLVLDHLTLDWQHPLRDRVASAASAGCAGIGLLVNEYVRLCDGGFDIEDHEALATGSIEPLIQSLAEPVDQRGAGELTGVHFEIDQRKRHSGLL